MILDILKRPIKVGDTVLVPGYMSIRLDTVTTVTKVNRVTCTVSLNARRWTRDDGQWKSYYEVTPIRRRPDQTVVITTQVTDNVTNYPETRL